MFYARFAISDFGLARVDDPENNDRAQMSTYVATRWYRAPEVILGRKRYTKAVDVSCLLQTQSRFEF